MKTATAPAEAQAPIVRLLDPSDAASVADDVKRARAFTAPLVIGRELPTGEGVLAHDDGTAAILTSIGASPTLAAAAYLVHAADELGEPDAVLTPLFGESQVALVAHARKLGALQRTAQGAQLDAAGRAQQ
ncbi:MAG TPA: HD domain-containing protein, partial [Caldimonas sp.]|nr:HD domain-containing protein [Caldimonas sp.]